MSVRQLANKRTGTFSCLAWKTANVKTKDAGLHFIGAVLALCISVCPPWRHLRKRGCRGIQFNLGIIWKRVVSFTHPAALLSGSNPGTNWMRGSVGSGACLDVLVKQKLLMMPEIKPAPLVIRFLILSVCAVYSKPQILNTFILLKWPFKKTGVNEETVTLKSFYSKFKQNFPQNWEDIEPSASAGLYSRRCTFMCTQWPDLDKTVTQLPLN